MPRVSIVIPCYNAQRYVERTLRSLAQQTFGSWECVVVDDGSTDDSAGVVAAFTRDEPRISLVRQANAGVCHARNAGYAALGPSSDYLLFLDADDTLEPGMLARLVEYMDQHPALGVTYCTFTCIDEYDRPIPVGDARALTIERFEPGKLGVRALPSTIPETPFPTVFAAWAGLIPSNSLVRRAVYVETPGWDESLGQPADDTDLFLHLALRAGVHYLAEPLVGYRRHPTQSTTNHARSIAQEHKLYRKWASVNGMSASQQALLQCARRFREARLMPYLWARYGTAHLRAGDVVEGVKCWGRAVRWAAGSVLYHV